VFVAPEANLNDCSGRLLVHHFASDGGPGFPEWQTADGTYVVGQKVSSMTPDGGAASVPWLLIKGLSHGGTGPLSRVTYIQRLNTEGGVTPRDPCQAAENFGATKKVPYEADYYFYGE
jgi:hypothetical protein